MTPVAILVYVPDVEIGLQWYQKAFPEAVPMHLPDFDFTVLDVNGFSIEIVQSDDKVSEGKRELYSIGLCATYLLNYRVSKLLGHLYIVVLWRSKMDSLCANSKIPLET